MSSKSKFNNNNWNGLAELAWIVKNRISQITRGATVYETNVTHFEYIATRWIRQGQEQEMFFTQFFSICYQFQMHRNHFCNVTNTNEMLKKGIKERLKQNLCLKKAVVHLKSKYKLVHLFWPAHFCTICTHFLSNNRRDCQTALNLSSIKPGCALPLCSFGGGLQYDLLLIGVRKERIMQ